jgi:hypothetical protein
MSGREAAVLELQERDVSTAERKKLADDGKALPDGSFPIETRGDLRNAIRLHGKAKDKVAAKRHICRHAKRLGAEDMLPDSWKVSESWAGSEQRERAVGVHLTEVAVTFNPLMHPRDRRGRWRDVPGAALASIGKPSAGERRAAAAAALTTTRREAERLPDRVNLNRGRPLGRALPHGRTKEPPAASHPLPERTVMMRNLDALAHDQFADLAVANRTRARLSDQGVKGYSGTYQGNRGPVSIRSAHPHVFKVEFSHQGATGSPRQVTDFVSAQDEHHARAQVMGRYRSGLRGGIKATHHATLTRDTPSVPGEQMPLLGKQAEADRRVWGDLHGHGVPITVQSRRRITDLPPDNVRVPARPRSVTPEQARGMTDNRLSGLYRRAWMQDPPHPSADTLFAEMQRRRGGDVTLHSRTKPRELSDAESAKAYDWSINLLRTEAAKSRAAGDHQRADRMEAGARRHEALRSGHIRAAGGRGPESLSLHSQRKVAPPPSAENPALSPERLSKLPLYELANMARADWPKVYFGAVPYLQAMGQLTTHEQDYGYDSGRSIVNYFLANATTWRGEVAKAVKAELKRRVRR